MMALRTASATAQWQRLLRAAALIAAFEGAWFACVVGAAQGWPWAGTAVAAAVIVAIVVLGGRPGVDAALVAVALAIGLAWDSGLALLGWIAYAEPGPLPPLAPAWILALWALFAVMLREPLRWLHGRWLLAVLLGAVGGPLSYAAAARMGAIGLQAPLPALLALTAGWAVLTPLLLALARHWEMR